MKEFNPDETSFEKSVLETVNKKALINEYGVYIGLDVHKDSITIVVALQGRSSGEYRGEIANKPKTTNCFSGHNDYQGFPLTTCGLPGPSSNNTWISKASICQHTSHRNSRTTLQPLPSHGHQWTI
jgi:hypothetical protein